MSLRREMEQDLSQLGIGSQTENRLSLINNGANTYAREGGICINLGPTELLRRRGIHVPQNLEASPLSQAAKSRSLTSRLP